MVAPLTKEQEEARRRELMEQLNPEHPGWNGRFKSGTNEYDEMKSTYEQAMEELAIGSIGLRRLEYEDFKQKYLDYLKTPEWQEKRKICLKYYEHRCAVCNSGDKIDVHHRTYEHLFNEQPNELTALCRECHNLFHHRMNDWLYFNTNIPY